MTAPAREGLPAGMVAWNGGDTYPKDWDGEAVALSDGSVSVGHIPGHLWHPYGDRYIIAYTPRATPPEPSSEVVGLREMLATSLAKRSVGTMDPPWTGAFNAALDMVSRDTGVLASSDEPCTMGVGCDEAGVCYAAAHGDPSRCPKSNQPIAASCQPTPAPADDAEVRERSGVLEALETALHQYSDPMSPLNGHELGDRLASDVAEIVRRARARDAMLAASPKAPSVAIGAGEVAFRAGWIARGDYGLDRNDYPELLDVECASYTAALASASASIPADVERVRELLAALHYETLAIAVPAGSSLDIARDAVGAYFAARPSTGGAMDGEGGRG